MLALMADQGGTLKSMKAYLFGALAFTAAIVVFMAQNDTQVSVQFITWKSSEISLAVVILISACAGASITFLAEGYRSFRNVQKIRKLVKSNQQYEEKIQALQSRLDSPDDDSGQPGL